MYTSIYVSPLIFDYANKMNLLSLSFIINQNLTSGIFSDRFKIAKVTTINR